MSTEKINDEIDLIEVFFKIYIFIKKNFWFLFISAIIGGGLGYSTKFMAKEHYESSMLIESYTLTDDIIIEYFNSLQNIIFDQNHEYLSTKTGIKEKDLKNLKEITAEKLYDEVNKKDLEYIKVSVKSNSNLLFENLSSGLLKYLENKNYITKEIDLFIAQNNILISKIDDEIIQLDKLQQITIDQTPAKGDVTIYNDQKSFQSELIELLTKKLELEKELQFALPFRIIEDFSIYQKPVKKIITYTLSGGLIFGFIALFYLIFKNINKTLKEKETQLD